MPCIYQCTSPSGKKYTGQTINTHLERWKQHIRDAATRGSDKCRRLNAAIRHYGADTFTVVVVRECTVDELDDAEIEVIAQTSSMVPNGYNLTSGGNGRKQYSDESRMKMHDAQINANSHRFLDYPELKIPEYVIRHRFTQTKNGKTYKYRGYAVHKHPKCEYKFFNARDRPLEDAFAECIRYLRALDEPDYVKPEKVKLPDHIHPYNDKKSGKHGYKIVINGKILKRFCSKKLTLDDKLKQAIDWYNMYAVQRLNGGPSLEA